jgi:hypothetical protein
MKIEMFTNAPKVRFHYESSQNLPIMRTNIQVLATTHTRKEVLH